jgi:hypothetical protein
MMGAATMRAARAARVSSMDSSLQESHALFPNGAINGIASGEGVNVTQTRTNEIIGDDP